MNVKGDPKQSFYWRYAMDKVANLTEMGQRMTEDPDVVKCAMKRMWNYAMSRGDIVENGADMPDAVVQPLVDDFTATGYNLREAFKAILLHDDFVRF